MNFKGFAAFVIIIMLTSGAMATYSAFKQGVFFIVDGEDIDLFGQSIGNGTIKDVTCISGCIGFNNTDFNGANGINGTYSVNAGGNYTYAEQYSTLQNAINATKHTLIIANGTYNLTVIDVTNPILQILKSNISIKGAGIGKTILKMSANGDAFGNMNISSGYPRLSGSPNPLRNIEISDITIDGSGYNTGYGMIFRNTENLYIHDVEFINMQSLVIHSNNTRWINTYMHDFTTASNGIMFQGGSNFMVNDNLFERMNDDMIAVNEVNNTPDIDSLHDAPNNFIISGNIGNYSTIGNCYATYGAKNGVISNNYCGFPKASGIAVSTILNGNSFGTNDVVVNNNVVYNATAYGIQISSGVDSQTVEVSINFVVSSNLVNKSGGGLLISNVREVLISNNRVINSWDNTVNRGSGIVVYGERIVGTVGNAGNITVTGNVLTKNIRYGYANFSGGAAVDAVNDVWLFGNDLRFNNLGATGTESGSGTIGIFSSHQNRGKEN